MIESAIAAAASILTAVQLVPQTLKVIHAKNRRNISKTSFGMITVSSLLWLVHGLNRMDPAIIFANIVTFCCASTVLYLRLRK